MLRRGEVRWTRLSPVEGHEQDGNPRPFLIVSDDRYMLARKLVVGFPLTTNDRLKYPLAVEIPSVTGRRSFALPGQIRTLALTRFGTVLAVATEGEMEACFRAMMQICGRVPPMKVHNDG